MAEVDETQFSIMSLEDELTCSICLSTFDCPVTIPCGHNFCQDCLLESWKDSYSCPQCRTVFATKPELKKNTVLTAVVETFKVRSDKSEASLSGDESEASFSEDESEASFSEDESEAVRNDVIYCDTCMEAEASKTCLTCMASYCEEHLRPHLENPVFRLHQLSEPVGDLSERICTDHHKLMEFFCTQHDRLICSLCLQQVHKGCSFMTPEEQRSLKESDLRNKLGLLNEKMEKTETVVFQMNNMQSKLKDAANKRKTALAAVYQQMRDLLAHMEEAEARIAKVESSLEKVETSVTSAMKRILLLEAKTDDLENRGRRKNLRVFGIREGAEGRQPLFDFISNMLPKWLELPPDKSFTLERVHRTLSSGKPNQGRAVLIRFLKFPEKEFVYQEARKRDIIQDGAKITFAQDLSAETVRIRRGFHPVVKLFVDIGAFRGFQHNPCKLRILHGGKIHLFSTPQEAEKFYKTLPK